MKKILLGLLFLASYQNLFAQVIVCEGQTNDINVSENVRFELTIKKDTTPIFKNFGPFYKSSIKYFFKTNTSFTGIDITDHISLRTNKIIFKGSFGDSQNLTLNYKTDGTFENAVMNYNTTIMNQPVQCQISGELPQRPVCSEDIDKTQSLLDAIRSTDFDMIDTAIECGANINLADKNGCTPLMIAIDLTCGQKNPVHYISPLAKTVQLIDALANNGAFVNTADIKGETPLIKATKLGLTDVYETFVALEADFDAKDQNGNTPLIYAVQTQNENLIEQLLEGNPDRKIKNNSGQTAYDIALKYKKESIIDLVRIADAQVLIEGQNDGTCTPLEIHLKQGQVIDLTLKATDRMFKLDSSILELDLMADRNDVAKKTFALNTKGIFKFTCGYHGANKPVVGLIKVD